LIIYLLKSSKNIFNFAVGIDLNVFCCCGIAVCAAVLNKFGFYGGCENGFVEDCCCGCWDLLSWNGLKLRNSGFA